MTAHNILGRQGEEEACRYLLRQDYHILERNWRGQDCEVDIIADEYGEIVFVEVKTRTSIAYEMPEEAVDAQRMYRLSRASEEYLYRHNLQHNPFRFDIIALHGPEPPFQIRHIKNAFRLKPYRHRTRY